MITSVGATTVLEVGAGRDPLFDRATLDSIGVSRYILNDIDPGELALAPPGYEHALFDFCGTLPADAPRDVDFLFSRSVVEHLGDTRAGFRNARAMLRDGGVMFHFFPTLFASPFLVNRVFPEALADRVLQLVRPRDRDVSPKFPARYDLCRATEATRSAVADLGFRSVEIQPFYAHPYYQRIPVARTLQAKAAKVYERFEWRGLAAYAVLVARR